MKFLSLFSGKSSSSGKPGNKGKPGPGPGKNRGSNKGAPGQPPGRGRGIPFMGGRGRSGNVPVRAR